MASLSTMQTETQRLLDDSNADRWSTTVLQDYLNEAQLEFNRLTRLYKTTYSAASASGTGTYSFTDANGPPLGPIERMIRGTEASGTEMIRTTDYRMDRLFGTGWTATSSSTSDRWTQDIRDFNTIRVYPLPNATAQTFTAYATGIPATLSAAGDTPGTSSRAGIPVQYHYALPYYAAHKCLLWNNDATSLDLAERYKRKFDEIVNQCIMDVGEIRSLKDSTNPVPRPKGGVGGERTGG